MKKIFLFITFGLFAASAFSQPQQNRHEFSVWAGGGINSLQSTDLATGKNSLGFGVLGGIGYNYFFNYHWSIGTGAEFSWLNGTLKYDKLTGNYLAVDKAPLYNPINDEWVIGTDFSLQYNANNYKETQRAFYINIPLMVKYQVDVYKQHKFYAAAGGKIGIPISGKYKGEGSFSTKFYEPGTNNELVPDGTGSFTDRGIGTYSVSTEGDIDFKLNFMLSAEVGMKWKLSEALALYTGIYLDKGLNNIRENIPNGDNNNDEIFVYNADAPDNYSVNSVTKSRYNGNETVGYMSTLGLGLKAQLTFGINPFTRKPTKAEREAAEKAALAATEAAKTDKPFEGLTAAQMADIMGRSNKEMMDFQRKEFDALKELLTAEAPELTQAIINFDLNKKEILPRMYSELDRKVVLMNKYPKAKLLLEGHTDDLGSAEYNFELGLDRANAAKNYMVKKGINPNRLEVVSKGKTNPMVPNSDEANRFRNRRVEFILQQ